MTKTRISLSISVMLSMASLLYGCHSDANLTEQERIERAKDFESKGNLKAGIIELKNALEKNPDSAQARLLLGQIYLKVGMGSEAEKELSRAEKLGVKRDLVTPKIGEALILNKEFQKVLNEVHASQDDPPRLRAQVAQLQGDALLGLRKFDEGCARFESAHQIDPQWYKALMGLARCSYTKGDKERARDYLVQSTKLAPQSSEPWLLLSEMQRTENHPSEALESLNNAVKADNSNINAISDRATLKLSTKDISGAKKDAELLKSLYPNHYIGNYLLALIAFNEKKLAEAKDLVAKSQKQSSNYVPAMLLAGSIEFGLGNYGTAESYLAKVSQLWPRHQYATRLLAATQLRLGRADAARKTLSSLHPESSTSLAVQTTAGEIELTLKNYTSARSHFEKANDISPRNPEVLTKLGITKLAMGDLEGLKTLGEASAASPHIINADNALIIYQLDHNLFDAALVSIENLEKKQPGKALTWSYRGSAYLGKQDYAKARQCYEQALKIDPKQLPAIANLAQIDIHDNRIKDAEKRFLHLLEIDPANIAAMTALAGLANRNGDANVERTYLEKAAKAAPRSLEPLALLSSYHLRHRDPGKALIYARQAVDAHPQSPEAYSLLASAQMATRDIEGAISTHKKLVDLTPRSAESHLRLGLALLSKGDAKTGRDSLGNALKLSPTHPGVLDALLRLDLSEGKFNEARDYARELQRLNPDSPLGLEREGDILAAQRAYPQAITLYAKALNLNKTTAGFIKLAGAYQLAANTKAADNEIFKWLSQFPKDNRAREYAAEHYMLTNRSNNAIAQYEYLAKINPGHALYLNNLANLYFNVHDSRALGTAEQAYKLAPELANVQDTYGWILLNQGKATEALTLLTKAKSNAPRSASIRYHYAAALAQSGESTQAKKELQSLLNSHTPFPDSAAAEALLKSL